MWDRDVRHAEPEAMTPSDMTDRDVPVMGLVAFVVFSLLLTGALAAIVFGCSTSSAAPDAGYGITITGADGGPCRHLPRRPCTKGVRGL